MNTDKLPVNLRSMRAGKLSVNRGCAAAAVVLVLLSAAMLLAVYAVTENILALGCALIYAVGVLLCMVLFLAFVRRKLILFSDSLCVLLDDMLDGRPNAAHGSRSAVSEEGMASDGRGAVPVDAMVSDGRSVAGSGFCDDMEEGLFYKIRHRISRLYEVLEESRRSIARERADLQELISDISHQVKTPMANLKILNATLLEQQLPPQKQREFLGAMGGQMEKLDFLLQAMIKTSRLEAGVITLKPKPQTVYETLAAALGEILPGAEKKRISVTVDCPETLLADHDRKWTGEALFNILDNAVKYTPEGGKLCVSVSCQELYIKIDISDTGIGIPEAHQGAVFLRFYREEAVHDAEGIGIGLYLAREIIQRQRGFISVASQVGQGSTFSVFLPRA